MPLVKEDTSMKEQPSTGYEKVEMSITVTEPTADDIRDVIERIGYLLKYLNIEYLEVRAGRLYYRHLPEREVNESEKLIDWYMKTIEED